MPIQANCPSCGRRLEVNDSFAGRSVRCPICSSIHTVPGQIVEAAEPSREELSREELSREDLSREDPTTELPRSGPTAEPTTTAIPTDSATPTSWLMRTPEGQAFGPVNKSTLDEWVVQGRVTHECYLRPENAAGWQTADEVYLVLRPGGIPSSIASQVSTDSAATAGMESAFSDRGSGSTIAGPASQQYTVPHRGGLILGLGIAGFVVWFICPVLSIMAWVMGSSDLNDMEARRMDPSGKPLTRAGQILGMIMSLVWIVAAVIMVFVFLLGAASGF